MDPYKIIKQPVLTERSTALQTDLNKYTFDVDPRANKVQIRQAIEQLFGVNVVRVNTMRVRGKPRRVRYQSYGHTPERKKAIVTLKEGQKIEIL